MKPHQCFVSGRDNEDDLPPRDRNEIELFKAYLTAKITMSDAAAYELVYGECPMEPKGES